MSKKMIYLVSFVLVLGVAGNASADLVAYWKLDEGSDTTAFDTSGKGNDGTFTGDPQWVAGYYGGALEFDGTDGNIDCGNDDSLNIADEITLSAWINMTQRPDVDNWYTIPWKEGAYSMYLYGADNTVTTLGADFWLDTGRADIWNGPDIDIPPNDWTHIAVTFNGTDFEFYVNGEHDYTQNEPATIEISAINLLFTEDGSNFKCLVDDVRIYNRALTQAEILAAMEGGEEYPYALSPVPEDGVYHPDTWANIAWRAGDFAVSHDVYLGDNFDDVSAGAESMFQGNLADKFLIVGFPGFAFPDGLVPGTTYYWRIDEVNDAEPNSPWKGDVWSFTIPPKTAYLPDPADGAESVSVDVQLSWTAGFGSKLHTPYFGETFEEVDNATGGQVQGTTTYSPGPLKMAKTYYWRVDEFDVFETHKGNVWSFTTEGAVAALNPTNGAVDVTQTPILTWEPGFGASHEIYFGTDVTSLELKGSGNLGSESYDPGQLEWDTTYYWRVDEANSANADSPWAGPLWSFTTANFLIIDDFESYNDLDPADPASNRIFNVWLDGFDNPAANGSVVGNANAPFAEQTIVHGGLQSMPMAYDNAVGKSEATLTLTSNRDWTVNGVDTLTIWYRGDAANAAETMYVMLNGSAGVDNDDPDAALAAGWTEWNIPLQVFTDQGVNLANVTSITLGLRSGSGGAGMLFIDDIRLYPPAQPAANELSKWELTWSDEFDGESIDLTKWTHMIGDGTDYGEQPGWGNNEKQFYTDDPANSGIIIDDEGNSVLFIEAIMTNVGESEYTSAKLTTESLFAFRFGKIEARIKLPFSQGIWPAFWMLGSNKPEIDWPGCGEIDIMEMLGGAEETVYGNIHYVNSDHEHDEDLGFSILGEGKYSDDYHIYSIEWSPGNIKWLVDGEYFHEIEITADMKEFLRSHFLILNIAVGGYWPGYPDETSVFPQRMYVDYVRIYQDTTLTDIPDEPALDVDEETMGLGSTSALAAINSDFTPFHNIKIVKYGPASPDISVSTFSIDGKTSILAVYSGGNWGGFWFKLDSPIDMSEYHDGNLVVMLDVPENIADFEVKLESIGGFGSVNLLDYPSEAVDNNFEIFTIPLADFVALGLNLESLTIPFALWNPKGIGGEYTGGNVLVDNIYFDLSN